MNPPLNHECKKDTSRKIKRGYQLVTNLFRTALLLHSLSLGSRTVLISSANVNGVITPKPAVPGKDIGTQHTCELSKEESVEI